MDLNYLFYRQQVEHSLARAARGEAARRVHGELAKGYEAAIVRETGNRSLFGEHRAS